MNIIATVGDLNIVAYRSPFDAVADIGYLLQDNLGNTIGRYLTISQATIAANDLLAYEREHGLQVDAETGKYIT